MNDEINIDRNLTEKFGSVGQKKDRRGILRMFGATLVLISSLIIAYTAYNTINQAKNDAEKSLRSQVNILMHSRSELIQSWLDDINEKTERITNADIFRIFAVESRKNATIDKKTTPNGSPVINSESKEQLPYLNRILSDFVKKESFTKAFLVNTQHEILLSSSPEKQETLVSSKMFALVDRVFASKNVLYSSIRAEKDELLFDILVPVFGTDVSNEKKKEPVAVFVFTLPIRRQIASYLTLTDSKSIPGTLRLFQQTLDGSFDEIQISNTSLVVSSFSKILASGMDTSLIKHPSMDNEDHMVFTSVFPMKKVPWYIVWEVPVDTALSAVQIKKHNIITLSVLAIFFITTSFIAFWWYSRNRFNMRMSIMYQKLARKIETQKWLLDSINHSVAEAIGLKNDKGIYLYANPAFSALVNKPMSAILGRTDADIFGEIVAHRLEYLDKHTMKSKEPVTSHEELHIGTKKHYLNVSKAPLNDSSVAQNAIVTIISDNTALIEAQMAQQKATNHTIIALSKTIEMRDPHLSGHSRRVSLVSKAIAQNMGLSQEDVLTIEMAGNLSQIGKLAIPRTILTKEARLTEQEISIVQKHIDNAIDILKEVEFDIPVRETLYQMYERLDGEGYPKGLKGEEISIRARILGIADYFCARIEPRSYRSAISPEETLDILESMPDRYDANVIKALRSLIRQDEFKALIKHG